MSGRRLPPFCMSAHHCPSAMHSSNTPPTMALPRRPVSSLPPAITGTLSPHPQPCTLQHGPPAHFVHLTHGGSAHVASSRTTCRCRSADSSSASVAICRATSSVSPAAAKPSALLLDNLSWYFCQWRLLCHALPDYVCHTPYDILEFQHVQISNIRCTHSLQPQQPSFVSSRICKPHPVRRERHRGHPSRVPRQRAHLRPRRRVP